MSAPLRLASSHCSVVFRSMWFCLCFLLFRVRSDSGFRLDFGFRPGGSLFLLSRVLVPSKPESLYLFLSGCIGTLCCGCFMGRLRTERRITFLLRGDTVRGQRRQNGVFSVKMKCQVLVKAARALFQKLRFLRSSEIRLCHLFCQGPYVDRWGRHWNNDCVLSHRELQCFCIRAFTLTHLPPLLSFRRRCWFSDQSLNQLPTHSDSIRSPLHPQPYGTARLPYSNSWPDIHNIHAL